MFKIDRFAGLAASPPAGGSVNPHNPLQSRPALNGKTIFAGDVDTMPFLDQGRTNGCGTTSLAMIMTYLGKPTSQAAVDSDVRRTNIFSSPYDLVEHARARGLEAEMYNHGSIDELKSYVDRGIPTQCLISADGSGSFKTLHYVAVIGYGTDPGTGTEYVLLHDPNRGDDPSTAGIEGEVVRMPLDEFKGKWSAPPAGFENLFIAYGAKGTPLPSSRTGGIEGTLATAEGVADLMNGIDRLRHAHLPDGVVQGALGVSGGATAVVGGAIGAGMQLSGEWAKDKLDGMGYAGNVLSPVVHIWTGAGAAIGTATHANSEIIENLGEAAKKLGDGDVAGAAGEVGDAVVEAGKGVVAVAEEVGKTTVGAVKGFFSGW